jgi:hypothetical protein
MMPPPAGSFKTFGATASGSLSSAVHFCLTGVGAPRARGYSRHAGQAAAVTRRYAALAAAQKAQLLAFLNSL